MPRPKGLPKTGGRKKGSKNKIDTELKARLAEKYSDWCPVEAMCDIAKKARRADIKLAALKEVSQYLYPKRKAIEHSGTVNHVSLASVLQNRQSKPK